MVLGRKKNQSIMIGDHIEIMILDIDGDNVRIGVQAPKNIHIYRKELLKEIELVNIKSAVKTKPGIPVESIRKIFKKT